MANVVEDVRNNTDRWSGKRLAVAAAAGALGIGALVGGNKVLDSAADNIGNVMQVHQYENYYGNGANADKPLPGAVAVVNNEPNANALAAEIAKPEEAVNVSHIIQAEAPTIAYGQKVVLPEHMLQDQYQKQTQPNQLPTVTPSELPQQ